MKLTTADYPVLFENMKRISHATLTKVTPMPMIVGSPSTPLGNDVDPTKKMWVVEGGLCGFGYVRLSGRSGFAKWLLANDLAMRNTYSGGITVHTWARLGFADGGQSYERNSAMAGAMAEYLRAVGFADAWAESRVD
jgi:hypothetical protein